jgi:hypothetical protein
MRTRQCNQLTDAAVATQHRIANAYNTAPCAPATGRWNSAAVRVCSTLYKGDSIRTLTMSHARHRCAAPAAAERSVLGSVFCSSAINSCIIVAAATVMLKQLQVLQLLRNSCCE